MVSVVSFNKRIPPGTVGSRGTLAELMAKSKAAADAKTAPMEMETPTIMQGFGKVAQIVSGGIQQGRAERQEGEARAELARLVASKGLEQMDPQTLAQIGMIDPEMQATLRAEAVQARQDAAARAEAARLHEDTQLEARTQLATEQGFTHAERAGPGGTQEFTTGEREGSEAAAKTLQDNRLRAEAEQNDLQRKFEAQQPNSPGAKVLQDYMNGKYGELGSVEAIKAREADFVNATGQLTAQVQREQITSTKDLATQKIQAEKDAADVLAKQPQTDTAKAYQDEKLGKYGVPGSPESLKRMNDEIAYATSHPENKTIFEAGETAFEKALGEGQGKNWAELQKFGAKAATNRGKVAMLKELAAVNPSGPVPDYIIRNFGNFSTVGQAFTGIVQSLAPEMHAPGSGSQSDIEFAGVIASLGSMANYPEANQIILSLMEQKAAIDIEVADIIDGVTAGTMDRATAQQKMRVAQSKSLTMPPDVRALVNAAIEEQKGAGTAAGTGDPELDERMKKYPARQ